MQHLGEGQQRQPDKRVGIPPLKRLKQRNPQPFTLKAARTQRLFQMHIAGDFGVLQCPEMDDKGFRTGLQPPLALFSSARPV